MKFIKKMSKKKKIVIIVLIVIAILIIRGNIKAKQALLEENKIETEAIEKRTIAKSVSATGNITTENSKDIVSTLSGSEIATVNVVEGQKVAVGDVICTFDMSSVQNTLSDAKSSANISNAQSNLGIESAQRNLNDAVSARDSQIVSAQQEVETARQAYENAQNQVNSTTNAITTKQAELENLKATYTNTQTAFAALKPTDEKYNEQKTSIETMQKQIETLSAEIASLQSGIQEQQAAANQLKTAFDAAVSALNTTTTAQDSNVAAMQDNLTNAKLSAQAAGITQNGQLNTYEEQLEKGIVVSNIAGTVTSVNVKPGDLYTGSTIATISGVDNFIVEAQIDEYDIADIKTGMKALIKTDSTKDEELQGVVSYVAISPTADNSITATATAGKNVTYKIQITLNEQNERLRLGMNAKISIILDSKENVWTVPYDAVYEREDGTHYIEILKDSETEEKEEFNVETGIEGTYYVEIISPNLKEGMEVVLPKQEVTGTSIQDLIMEEGPDAGL